MMSYHSTSKDNIFRYILAFCLVQISRFGDCIKFDANTMTSLLCVLLLFLMLNHTLPLPYMKKYFFRMMSYHSTSKGNIVRHNISYNFAFGSNSLSFIFLKIFAKKYLGQPLKVGIRLTFLSITFEPMDRFCSSSNLASQIKIEVF